MKRDLYKFKKILGGFILGATLFVSFNSNLYANVVNITKISSRELPKPVFQNAYGTFDVDFSNFQMTTDSFVANLNTYFDLDKNHRFELVREINDKETGFNHYSYQHYYKDFKVEGDIVFVHSKNGNVVTINGQVLNISNLNTSASIDNEKATQIALRLLEENEQLIASEVDQLIIKAINQDEVTLKLAKKLNVVSYSPLKSFDVYIDAQSGEIIDSFNKIHTADTPSTSATYFRGSQSITVDSYSGGYRLKDNTRNIHTRNAANWTGGMNSSTGELSGNITEYTNATANFTNTTMKPAVEVHWGMSKTYDYYRNIHNRNSYDNKGSIIRNYYNPPSKFFDGVNAGAYDNQGVVAMLYGNGMGDVGAGMQQVSHPVVALDVAGHEYSHLVIGRNGTGGLNYKGESGALNESFADIFGTAIEFYVNNKPNWTIGEGLWNLSVITPNYMRSMSDPNSAPAIIDAQQPDTYKGKYWANTASAVDDGGVHTNSGVGNFWFYLLSQGGSGVNDIGNNYDVVGITINKAEKIAYKALMTGLTPSATYFDAFNATKQAAASLYGAGSNEWNQVVNAWYAVGIGNAPASNQNIEMKTKLNVYPNPVIGDEFTIDSNLEEQTTVEMFDLTGKQIISPRIIEGSIIINVQNYNSGIYILKFKSIKGEYSHKLIIK